MLHGESVLAAIFWSAATVAVYAVAKLLDRRCRAWWSSPLLTAPLVLLVIVVSLHVGYGEYIHGTHWLVTLLAPEPAAVQRPVPRGFGSRVRQAVVEPLAEFLSRRGAWTILAFVALFKLGEAMAGIMTPPFYRALGFDRPEIAGAGPFSLGGTLAGITFGGWLVAQLGVGRALLRTGWAQTIAMGMYLVLAFAPGDLFILYATVSVEAFAQGMADAAFLTFLSGLCAREFAATHYALLSSLAAIAVHTLGGFSGVLAASVGWQWFYTLCLFAALPSMGLMLRLLKRYPPPERSAARQP